MVLGLGYGQKIDLWSLGAILAELHTGYVLFQNDSLATMLARCARDRAQIARALRCREGGCARPLFAQSQP